MTQAPMPASAAGAPEIPGYRVLQLLGRGGMSVVYKAEQTKLERLVAIKTFHEDAPEEIQKEHVKRFYQEARVMAKTGGHENIVQVFDVVQDAQGHDYLVMEYVEGMDFYARLQMPPEPDLPEIVEIICAAAEGLHHAHQHGIIHRDIKPQNIMIDRTGKVKVMDFGVARVSNVSMNTATGLALGTLHYMAPEQAFCEPDLDGRVDVYALSITLYQAVCGRLPFDDPNPFSLAEKQCFQPPPAPGLFCPGLDHRLETIILKGLAKKKEDRFQSTLEMATALRGLKLESSAVAAVPANQKIAFDHASRDSSDTVAVDTGALRAPAKGGQETSSEPVSSPSFSGSSAFDDPGRGALDPPDPAPAPARASAQDEEAEETFAGMVFRSAIGWMLPAALWSALAVAAFLETDGQARAARGSVDALRTVSGWLPDPAFAWAAGAFEALDQALPGGKAAALGICFAGFWIYWLVAASLMRAAGRMGASEGQNNVRAPWWLAVPLGGFGLLSGLGLLAMAAWFPETRQAFEGLLPADQPGRAQWLGANLALIGFSCLALAKALAPAPNAPSASRLTSAATLGVLAPVFYAALLGFGEAVGSEASLGAIALHATLLCYLRARSMGGLNAAVFWAGLFGGAAALLAAAGLAGSSFALLPDSPELARQREEERSLGAIRKAHLVHGAARKPGAAKAHPTEASLVQEGYLRPETAEIADKAWKRHQSEKAMEALWALADKAKAPKPAPAAASAPASSADGADAPAQGSPEARTAETNLAARVPSQASATPAPTPSRTPRRPRPAPVAELSFADD